MSCFAILTIKGKEPQRIDVTDNYNALDEYISTAYKGYFKPTETKVEEVNVSDVEAKKVETVEKPAGKSETDKLKKELNKKSLAIQTKINKAKEELKVLEDEGKKETVQEEEQYQPITTKDIFHEKLTRDNATDYEEDEKEDDSGRTHTYISSLTVEVTNTDGNTVGALIKLKDEDGNVSWNAEDADGNQLSQNDYDTQAQAKQAIVDKWNKTQKREFDREAAKAKKKDAKATEDRNKKVAGKKSQIIDLERQYTALVEDYSKQIEAIKAAEEDVTKPNDNVSEEVQAKKEVEDKEPANKTGSTSISIAVRDKIKEYFDKLVGKDVITVSTAKLEEIAKEKGFDSYKEIKDDAGVVVMKTSSGKIYGLFVPPTNDQEQPHIYLVDNFATGTLLEEMAHLQYFTMKIASKTDKEAGRIIKEAERILKPIVDKVIEVQGKVEPTESGIDTDVRTNAEDNKNRDAVLQKIKDDYGIDLTSAVYQQQSSESDADYRDRIFDEVWSKLTALAGENRIKEKYTFWNDVNNVFVQIQKWFAKLVGLNNTKFTKLTPYKLGQVSFNALLRGEYLPKAPVTIEVETEGAYNGKPVSNKKELFDRLPDEVQAFFQAMPGWAEAKIESISTRALKILDDSFTSLSTKMAMLGHPATIFKSPWNRAMKVEVVKAFLRNIKTHEDYIKATRDLLDNDENVLANSYSIRAEIIAMEELGKYLRGRGDITSQDLYTQLALKYVDVSHIGGIVLNMFSPAMSWEDVFGSFALIQRAGIHRALGLEGSRATEFKDEVKKIREALSIADKTRYGNIIEKLKNILKNTVSGQVDGVPKPKITSKAELVKAGFTKKNLRDARINLINVAKGKISSGGTRASAAGVRASAEPINEAENALADLLLADYQNNRGNILQAVKHFESHLNKLKDVDGENIYEMLMAQLPFGYAVNEQGESVLVENLLQSDVFKAKRTQANKAAALATIDKRVNGTTRTTKDGKTVVVARALNQKTAFDYIDNFVKDLLGKVLRQANVKLSDSNLTLLNTDMESLKKPSTQKESPEIGILRVHLNKAEELLASYIRGDISLNGLESEMRLVNKSMHNDLKKYSSLKDTFPTFELTYDATPTINSMVKYNNNLYELREAEDGKGYDDTGLVWVNINDARPVGAVINEKLNKAYQSKPFYEEYSKNALNAFNELVAKANRGDNVNEQILADKLQSAYDDFKKRNYTSAPIHKIEDLIYAAFNVDVTGSVALRHTVEDNAAQFDQTLDEIIDGVYSKGDVRSLAKALTERLGIDEADAKKVEQDLQLFIEGEIKDKVDKEIAAFVDKDNTALVREALRLAKEGKLTEEDLLPLYAAKFNLNVTDEVTIAKFRDLVNAIQAKGTDTETRKAMVEFRQFLIDHKNEPLTVQFLNGFASLIYAGYFTIKTFFSASTSLVAAFLDITPFWLGETGKMIGNTAWNEVFIPMVDWVNDTKGSVPTATGITLDEWQTLNQELIIGVGSEMLRKGIPEILRVIVTGQGSDVFMAEDARLRRKTWHTKIAVDLFNEYLSDILRDATNTAMGIYKISNPILTRKTEIVNADGTKSTKTEKVKLVKGHPLYPYREYVGKAIAEKSSDPLADARNYIQKNIIDTYESIKDRPLYKGEKEKNDMAKSAVRWIDENAQNIVSYKLPDKADISIAITKDLGKAAALAVSAKFAALYRTLLLPALGDAFVSNPVSYAYTIIDTHIDMMEDANRDKGKLEEKFKEVTGYSNERRAEVSKATGVEYTPKNLFHTLGQFAKTITSRDPMSLQIGDIYKDWIERPMEMREDFRPTTVWDTAKREIKQYTTVSEPRDTGGFIANTASYIIHGWFQGTVLDTTNDEPVNWKPAKWFPYTFKHSIKSELKGLGYGLTSIAESIIIPFILKTVPNIANYGKTWVPLGYQALYTNYKFWEWLNKDNINPNEWKRQTNLNPEEELNSELPTVFTNGNWTIEQKLNANGTRSDNYNLYRGDKLKEEGLKLEDAKAKAKTTITIPQSVLNYMNPNMSFTGKYTGKATKMDWNEVNEREKRALITRGLLSAGVIISLFLHMWDFDEDENGKIVVVKNPEARIVINGNMSGKYQDDKSSRDGIKPLTVQWKTSDGKYVTMIELQSFILKTLLLPFVAFDDYMYGEDVYKEGDKESKTVFDSKKEAVMRFVYETMRGSLLMSFSEIFSGAFDVTTTFLAGLIPKGKPTVNQKNERDKLKTAKKIGDLFRETMYRTLIAPNQLRYMSSMNSQNSELPRYKATAKSMQPIADIMNFDYSPTLEIGAKLGLVDPKVVRQFGGRLLSDKSRYVGMPFTFGIGGDFEDNFSEIYRSPRGSDLLQEFSPYGVIPFNNFGKILDDKPTTKSKTNVPGSVEYEPPLEDIIKGNRIDKSAFDQWGEQNGIGASYRYLEHNTDLRGLTFNSENLKLRKYVENLAPIIANQLYKNNIVAVEDVIKTVKEKVEGEDGATLSWNKQKHINAYRSQFNDLVISKSFEIATALGLVEMIKSNKANEDVLSGGYKSNELKAKNAEVNDKYSKSLFSDGTINLEAITTNPPEFSYTNFVKESTAEAPEQFMRVSIELDTNLKLAGEEERKYDITTAALRDILKLIPVSYEFKKKGNKVTEKRLGVILDVDNKLKFGHEDTRR